MRISQPYVLTRGLILSVMLLVASANAGAQARQEQSLVWFGYFATVNLDSAWYSVFEFQERRWSSPLEVHQRLVRGHLHRRLGGGFALGVGFTYFLQGAQTPEAAGAPLVPELRPHVQIDHRTRRSPSLAFAQRARLEYRMFSQTSAAQTVDRFELAGRLRYRTLVDWTPRPDARLPLTLRVADEVHLMFGDRPLERIFDQNRLQLGVVTPLSRNLSLETAYLWWYQERRAGGVVDRNILRLSVNHRVR